MIIFDYNTEFINYFFKGEERVDCDGKAMQENRRAMLAAGVVFFVLGTVLFVVSDRFTVQVGLMPFTVILIFMLVAGVVLFGTGLLLFVADRYWSA